MWKIAPTLMSLLALISCVAIDKKTYKPIELSVVVRGGVRSEGDYVKVIGFIDTSVLNIYSLQGSKADLESDGCVALILDKSDKRRAKRADGNKVLILGSLISSDRINSLFPEGFGEINGRSWAGTNCKAEYAIYVKEMQVL